MDKIWLWVAYRLPKNLVKWAAIRWALMQSGGSIQTKVSKLKNISIECLLKIQDSYAAPWIYGETNSSLKRIEIKEEKK